MRCSLPLLQMCNFTQLGGSQHTRRNQLEKKSKQNNFIIN